MADYYSILRKAITELDPDSVDARYKLYERARKTLSDQINKAEPTWREEDANFHFDLLNAAIVRIEREWAANNDETAANVVPAHPRVPVKGFAPSQRAFELSRGGVKRVIAVSAVAILLLGFGVYYASQTKGIRLRSPEPAAETSAHPPTQLPSKEEESGGGVPAANSKSASYLLRRQRVYYRTTHPIGSVIVSQAQRFLYWVQPQQVAVRYAIAVGPECENVVGMFRVSEKVDSPGWGGSRSADTGTSSGSKSEGTGPFGPRAVYLGNGYALHGTQEPERVGQSASYGCFHLWNDDIVELYQRVPINERVVVAR
jgi:lipoprotein-anchoring transpeptidase ErfK/SrfK